MSRPDFGEFESRDRRLALLQALEQASQRRANHLLLHRFVEALGHSVSIDVLVGDLTWLDETGLVKTVWTDKVMIATLTQRGADVATDRAQHPGVSRPAA